MGIVNINGITGGSSPYTIKVYQVGNSTPVFTDTTNNTNYTGTFSHINGQSYYAVVEKTGCTSYTSGNSTLNCSTCNISISTINYSCNNNSSTYIASFTISGGNNNYLYSLDDGVSWSPTSSNFSQQLSFFTTSILISNSDFSCPTEINITPINPCELCASLTYDNPIVSCVTGSTNRKRVSFTIYSNLISGCSLGDFEYSDDGTTWIITPSNFNKVYNGYAANTILLRYSLYPNKVWTVNAPAFNPLACNEGFYYVSTTCSCSFNGGINLGGDWCNSSPKNYSNIPNSPSTYVSSISNPGDGNSTTNFEVPVYLAIYSPIDNIRLVFSKTGGTFLNGTTTYDTGYISGVYIFKHILSEGETVGVTIRSLSGGINCASVVTICGDGVNGNSFSWPVICSGLPNNQATVYWNEAILI